MDIVQITSRNNEQIKAAKRLHHRKHREREGLFFVEGIRLCEEALGTGLVQSLFYSERLPDSPRGQKILSEGLRQSLPVYSCTEAVLAELSDVVTGQGVFCVVRKPSWPPFSGGLMVIADGIGDPGNLGTLIRTAAGAGASGLMLVAGSVDSFNPKVVRASMGAIFSLPHWVWQRSAVLQFIEKEGIPLVAADLADAQDYDRVTYPETMALVIGSEAHGVHPWFAQKADFKVKIPLAGAVESLNAAVAAGILLYQIRRQHSSL